MPAASCGAPASDSVSASLSRDGRYVAFASDAPNLVPGDDNGIFDIFLKDLCTGEVTLVSADAAGHGGNAGSGEPSVSPSGRYVAFVSGASNLVPGDTNDVWDAFLRDRQAGTTERISLDSSGAQGNDDSIYGAISDSGPVR